MPLLFIYSFHALLGFVAHPVMFTHNSPISHPQEQVSWQPGVAVEVSQVLRAVPVAGPPLAAQPVSTAPTSPTLACQEPSWVCLDLLGKMDGLRWEEDKTPGFVHPIMFSEEWKRNTTFSLGLDKASFRNRQCNSAKINSWSLSLF